MVFCVLETVDWFKSWRGLSANTYGGSLGNAVSHISTWTSANKPPSSPPASDQIKHQITVTYSQLIWMISSTDGPKQFTSASTTKFGMEKIISAKNFLFREDTSPFLVGGCQSYYRHQGTMTSPLKKAIVSRLVFSNTHPKKIWDTRNCIYFFDTLPWMIFQARSCQYIHTFGNAKNCKNRTWNRHTSVVYCALTLVNLFVRLHFAK